MLRPGEEKVFMERRVVRQALGLEDLTSMRLGNNLLVTSPGGERAADALDNDLVQLSEAVALRYRSPAAANARKSLASTRSKTLPYIANRQRRPGF